MAFAVTARSNTNNGTTAAQTHTGGTFTPSANSLLVAAGTAEMDSTNGNATLPASPLSGGSLSYTERQSYESTDAPGFAYNPTGVADYRLNGGLFTAPVGGSPSSMSLVFDAGSGTETFFYSLVAVDVTGHNVSSPVVQSVKNKVGPNLNQTTGVFDDTTLPLNVTLVDDASNFVVGNLVIVAFGAGDDVGATVVAPTLGNEAMTQVYNGGNAYCHTGLWYRVLDGAEDDAVIRCTDLGSTNVGNGIGFAIEIAAAGAASTSGLVRRRPLALRYRR